jgi:hypothetical protein
MSRVTYTNTPATADQESLRRANGVRLVNDAEEGAGVNTLPEGVYGFTYSPGLPNAPLFATRRFRSYEIHKVAGDVFIVGFMTAEAAEKLSSATDDVTMNLHPEPDTNATVLVNVPYARIHNHRQYAAPNQDGFTMIVRPLLRGALL